MATGWNVHEVAAATDDDGTLSVTLPLLDGNVAQGSLVVSMTADRGLRVVWEAEPDSEPLTGFEAWSSA